MKRLGTILLLSLMLVACEKQRTVQGWQLLNITGHLPDLQFTLTDADGRAVTQHSYAGKVLLLYFGYTHCPDVCPTTLAELAGVLRSLGAEAGRVRVLFVSVDPARDTPAVLKQYVQAFGPQFVGLSGTQDALTALTKRYRVAYRLGPVDAKGDYPVYHSSAVFVFDQRGRARLIGNDGDKPAEFTADLKRLLAE